MKRNHKPWILCALASVLLLTSVTACSAPSAEDPASSGGANLSTVSSESQTSGTQNPAPDYSHVYDTLIDQYANLISDPDSGDSDEPGVTGVLEAARNYGKDASAALGYAVADLSGDGIPELAIGTLSSYGGQIYAVYAFVNGTPQLILEGWYRNSYTYIGDGQFSYYGASSAAESARGTFRLTKDGTTLECTDFYFTHAAGDDPGDIRVYFNTTGSWDPADSKEADMTLDQFWALEEDRQANLELTSFTAIGGGTDSGENSSAAPSQVYVDYAPKGVDCDEIIVDSGEYSCRLLFTTDGLVSNFTMLNLFPKEYNDDGTIKFSVESAATGNLTLDNPIVVELTFMGDTVPNYGISYVDSNGTTHRFALMQSGYDGSVSLQAVNTNSEDFVLGG